MTPRYALQWRHRLEEVGERFKVAIKSDGQRSWIPLARLAHLKLDATPESIAKEAGLTVEGDAIQIPWRGSIEATEDQVLAMFSTFLEQDPAAFLRRPSRRISIPKSGELPQSAEWLRRFYGDDFLPREKKPLVVDLARCQGPFLRSVDDDPLQIVDAASQIASLAAGLRPDAVQAALDEGRFDPYLVAAPAPTSIVAKPIVDAFQDALLEAAPPGLRYVAFANGGAEANEKALHIARLNGPGGHRIVAFKGSFHGRTLLSLYSTWNPVKRAPYQMPGFETNFVDLATPDDAYADPVIPTGWRSAWSDPQGSRVFAGDDLLQAEIKTLLDVEVQFKAGDMLACMIEPYQCEGGDRSPTRRFFHGLRALTRAYGIPLLFDEVQSGFGLSGYIFWHHRFNLIDADGRPDGPDLVVGAKRAQVGYVISRWPDPEPTTAHAASMVRGLAHFKLLRRIPTHESYARTLLDALRAKWPDLISRPRVFGDAFAFDMPSRDAANHLIGQRFYRGYMVYIAGERTLRYRLNRGMRRSEVEAIFAVIDNSLTALLKQAGGLGPDLVQRLSDMKPPAWDAEAATPPVPKKQWTKLTIRQLDPALFDALHDQLDALEGEVYEPARRDSMTYLRTLVEAVDSLCFVAEDQEGVIGMSFAAPLELWPGLDGPRQDPHRGASNTLYSADISVTKRARGMGVTAQLRRAMLRGALSARTPEGTLRYAWITGRNRVGEADRMWLLNQRYGAYEVALYSGQYGELNGMTRYYRIPLRRSDRRPFERPRAIPRRLRFDQGINLPTGISHPVLERARQLGVFDEPALTKLTVSNFITAPYARYAEYLQRVAPTGNPHLYFTSSPDEMIDKTIRALKHNRKAGHVVIGLDGGYVGHTTAAARSLTAPAGDSPRGGFFGWPLIPHPSVDLDATIEGLDLLVQAHGADEIIGVFLEAVQARTGAVISPAAWAALCEWRDRTGVPLVLLETTTGMGRNGRSFWWVDSVDGDADVVLWWAGGQIGHVFSNKRTFVSKPLTLISTWDGDELSATRLLWQMYVTEDINLGEASSALEKALLSAFDPALLGGVGLYRTVQLGRTEAIRVQRALLPYNIDVAVEGDVLVVMPSLTVNQGELGRFGAALRAIA